MTRPNFSLGYAKNCNDSQYPSLWDGLVGAWCPSMGKQGSSLFDLSLYSRNATLTNMDASTDYVIGKFGYALDFDGTNDFLSIGHIPQIDDSSQDLSLAFFLKTTSSGGNRVLFSYDNNSTLQPTVDFYSYFSSSSGNLHIGGIGDTSEWNTGYSSSNLADDVWHHVAVVLFGTNEYVYVDGVQVATRAVGHSGPTFGSSHIFTIADNGNISHYQGQIEDFFLYNRALTPSEINDLYKGGSPLTPKVSISPYFLSPDNQFEAAEVDALSEVLAPTVTSDAIAVFPTNLDSLSEVLAPNINIFIPAPFGSKIIHSNPLYYVTDTSPAKLVEIDISVPTSPVSNTVILTGAEFAKDISINTSTDKIYVSCADGIVVEVDANDISIQTIIDLSDTDDMITSEAVSNQGFIFIGSENNTGELYSIEDKDTFLIDTDFQVLANKTFFIDSDFHSIEAFTMDSDFQLLSEQTFTMDTDFKCLTAIVDNIDPIPQTDCKVFIDAVELDANDVVVNSLFINKTVNEKENAIFTLCRRHDAPNTDLNGNTRTITNQNDVRIDINGKTFFTGKVSGFRPNYSLNQDEIIVDALGNETVVEYKGITLSLGSLDKRLSPYEILLQNFNIFSPDIDANDEDPERFKGIRVPLGEQIEEHVVRRTFFDILGNDAIRIQEGSFLTLQNHTYFWAPTVRKFGNYFFKIQTNFFDTTPGFTFPEDINAIANIPELDPTTEDKDADKEKPAYSFITPDIGLTGETSQIYFKYIGTSLSPISSDLWFLLRAKHGRQKIFDNTVKKIGDGQVFISDFTDIVSNPTSTYNELVSKGWITSMGFITEKFKRTFDPEELQLDTASCENSDIYDVLSSALAYTVGEAPFSTVSVRNGILKTKPKWVDEPNGWYSIKDEGYDYTEFVKQVAELEFKKLTNINGTVLPETSATITLSIDALLYYDLKVLNRIKIDNTTDVGIYKNQNGFPVAIKSMTIDCGNMNVTLTCDNKKSVKELDDLDGQFPCEEDQQFIDSPKRTLVALKSDMNARVIEGPKDDENEVGEKIGKADT